MSVLLAAVGVFAWQPAQACVAAADPQAQPAGAAALPRGWRLAGSAIYRWWGLEIYEARLWVPPDFDPMADWARQDFALELQYRRAFKGSDIAQRSLQEMRRFGPLEPAQAQQWLQAMQAAFPDVRPGECLSGWHRSGQGVRFLAAGRSGVEVADGVFAQRFFSIWLSERSAAAELRAALLGLAPPARVAEGGGR